MSRDPALLVPEFRHFVPLLQARAAARGYVLEPFFTLRDPWEQARLWRQSRGSQEIAAKIELMRERGQFWLAQVLSSVGPQSGPWATNATPGHSFHQWGEAVDFYWDLGGEASWEGHAYYVLGEEAARLGLCSGLFWKSQDKVHAQLRRGRVKELYSRVEINRTMQERFGRAA